MTATPAEVTSQPRLCLRPAEPRARPGFRLPGGTCDCHIHVFAAADRHRLEATRDYTPVEVLLDDYRRLMAAYGIDRAVLIQPSVYGTDNTLVLDALREEPDRLRAVAVIPADLSDGGIAALDRAGVRGVRINRVNPGGLPLAAVAELGRRLARFGWHIQLHVRPEELAALATLASRSPVPLVIDHFGLVPPADAMAADLVALVESGSCYVKLSAPYRIAGAAPPGFRPLVDRLVAARPDRLLWGSDWPHVGCFDAMPDDGDLAIAAAEWLPTAALRHAVFVANPMELYWGSK
jgi:predicted TIM-barrel fold metal-dependent hydrolase